MSPRRSPSEWEAAFNAADKDGSGTLEDKEFMDMLKLNNSNLSRSQIDEVFEYFDGPNGDKRITKIEFIKGLQKLEAFIDKLKEMFDRYDEDKSGYLEKNELRKVLESSGHRFTDEEMGQILQVTDSSGDGKVSFDEFLDACT